MKYVVALSICTIDKLLHNDLKTDVVLTSIPPAGLIGPVIIDLGKAYEISKGRVYNLSQRQREQYKVNHLHIAPDLRDGKCPQSTLSDIFSLGRIINVVNDTVTPLQQKSLQELSQKCMEYHMHERSNILFVKECVHVQKINNDATYIIIIIIIMTM